ncbi:MAG TPA: SemiSWEET family transporter [Gemmatimonadaceae bacterium]|nr:SemiSWEET family transporter [Gemmatimonadaceae bacterium]
MNPATTVGTISGVITVLSFVPQAIHAWRTRRTQDLSAGTFTMLVLQSAGWTTYGVLLEQAPIIWTNCCVLVLTLAILAAKLRHG